ncbi:uncharacterized protein LOC135497321 [Lineus longissimus]|uniref:uncharacterized protein LOC135497321 n=1 Tax=Lineus longissimus TaxID=88925 RepID=UPI002B4E5D19
MGEDTCDLQDTDLHDAVRYGDIDEVVVALKHGLDPNQIGMYEWTPLHEAACNGDQDILVKLLDNGGNPNKKDLLKGFSAIHYAAKNGHNECLKQLLENGGQFDILSNNGESCFDVATKECLQILQKYKIKTIIDSSESDVSDEPLGHNEETSSVQSQKETTSRVDPRVDDDVDGEILPKEPTRCSPRPTWVRDLGQNNNQEPIAGFVQLSFEYNSKKSSLKIRIWQISEILLPPVETSMFSAIYVKSYLQPDKKHQTKRRTEEIKLDNPDHPITRAHYKSMSHDKEVSLHAVFQPMTFRFSKPLDYEKVSPEMVAERTVEIVVCVVQKYTRKSFMIAKLLLPLKDAVKKLIREKVALKPCLQTNIQEKVRPYPMDVLKVMSNYRLFGGSNPNVRVSPLFIPTEPRAASDSDLQNVTVGSPSEAVVLSLPTEDPSDTDSLQSVSVEEAHLGSVCSVSVEEEPFDSGFKHAPRDINLSVSPLMKLREQSPKKGEPNPVSKGQLDIEGGQGSRVADAFSSAEDGHMTKFDTVEELNLKPLRVSKNSWISPSSSRPDSPVSYLTSSSRADTPTWDNYMEPLEITGEIPIDAKEEEYHPPMAISMNLPQMLQSFRPINLQKSDEIASLPGQAEFCLENDTVCATEKRSLPGKPSHAIAADDVTGAREVVRSASKRSVPVMGARAARSPPPSTDSSHNYKTRPFELRQVGPEAKSGPQPGRVLRVQPEGARNESSNISETSFVMLAEQTFKHQEAVGRHVPQNQNVVSGSKKDVGRQSGIAETSFSKREHSDVVPHAESEPGSSRVGRPGVPITQLHRSPTKTGRTSGANQPQKPEKPMYEFSEENLTITEPNSPVKGQGKHDVRVKSPSKLVPVSPAKTTLAASTSRRVDELPARSHIPKNLSPAQEDSVASNRPISPANWNETTAVKLKHLSKRRSESPSGSVSSLPSDRSMSPTNQRPLSPIVDVTKERLRQKLLMKKQRIVKQREHELLVLDRSHSKPGTAKAVPINPNDLESDV